MALEDFEADMVRCSRCSDCKFAPASQLDEDRAEICPSIARFGFHSYSAGGRFVAGLSLLSKRAEANDSLRDLVYRCQLCGACDVACKKDRELEPLEMMLEFRSRLVDLGLSHPALDAEIDGLDRHENMMRRPREGRGDWAEGLDVKRLRDGPAEIVYHAGCRLSYERSQWGIARDAITVLRRAGVDVAIAGDDEICCGGRAYEMGYPDRIERRAERLREELRRAGTKTLLTSCAHCFHAFGILYEKIGQSLGIEVVHIADYVNRLLDAGMLEFAKEVPLAVTYHDPCHLGRLAEPWVPWQGTETKVMQQLVLRDPPKSFRRGTHGSYRPPRELLERIPGVRLLEMKRVEAHSLCCGSGGGVREAYPEFAAFTAHERVDEAVDTGARALVSACPWCLEGLGESAHRQDLDVEVLDLIELVRRAL
ncbi:heterodisulfide reductase subunit D [Myxococcaceae bacterium]|jgi:Fe-S oxidoreductase|nr:heterodisulfide reductase subunit D [Myxococcaceae bacterium]